MEKLCERESCVLSSGRSLRHSRHSNIHAKPACRSKKRLTNQEFMSSDYYTSYIPCITAAPKEEYFPVGNKNRNQVGERKVFKNKGVLFYGLLCFMLFNLSDAWAQSAVPRAAEGQTEIKPLQIGDTIPEELWHLPLQVVNHLEGKDILTLNDYRDKKLIILDFWATWCGSCIDGMRQYLKDAERYDEYATILYTTTEGSEKINKFITGQTDEISNISSIVDAEVLKRYFPHRYLPHLVWLTSDGIIVDFTQKNALNLDNLKLAYSGRSLSVEKIDVEIERPLFLMDG